MQSPGLKKSSEKFRIIHQKIPVLEYFFKATIINLHKKRLHCRCFPVNFFIFRVSLNDYVCNLQNVLPHIKRKKSSFQ